MARMPEERYQSAQEMAEAVLGEKHVQKSVAVLAPDGLSVVAKKAVESAVPQRPVLVGAGAGASRHR